jgi:hypothetical protein
MTWIRLDECWPEIQHDVWSENPELHQRIERAVTGFREAFPVYVHERSLRCLDDLPRERPSGGAVLIPGSGI